MQSKLLSPDRMAKTRRFDRERKANRRSDPIQRQRYNDSQNALHHQSVATINSDARSTTAIGLDEDGGYEETKQNSPSTNNATQPDFSPPQQTARATTAIRPDEDGGYEETKQNSPSTNNATQPDFSSPQQTGAEVGLAPVQVHVNALR